MKNKWENYALKTRKIEKSYIRKHPSRSTCRLPTETSGGNCSQQSREIQEEKITQGEVYEKRNEEKSCKTSERRSEGIQRTNKRRQKNDEGTEKQQEKKVKKVIDKIK